MDSARYDAIIVGSGAGGAAAAYRLVQAGLRVALMEKGPRLPRDGSTLDIQRVVHQGVFRSREIWVDGHGKPLVPEEYFNVGGKTKWYGAALLRFAEHEFTADEVHGCRGWPIELADLAPYYDEAERLLKVRSFECEPDLARLLPRLTGQRSGWRATAMPLGLRAEIALDSNQAAHFDGFASTRGLKADAEQSLLSCLSDRAQFNLFENTEVCALLGSARSATIIDGVKTTAGRELRAPLVFLAAGALHSPRLRYLRAAQLDTLPSSSPIGQNLKLHLLTAMVAISARRITDLIRKTLLFTHNRFAHSSAQPLGFDGELIGTLMPELLPSGIRRQFGARAYGFFLQTEDGSDPRNSVREGDPGAAPVFDYDERRLPQALQEHRAFCRSLQRALTLAGLVSFTRRIGIVGTAHVCGSLVCGLDARDSAVDAQGRVHGLEGLYVVDGSVLPRSSRVNPSLTIYAWALRVADLVVKHRQSNRSQS